jgi:hypothetical protein
MHTVCFIIVVLFLIYMFPQNRDKSTCDVYTLQNCNAFEKDKITEYKSAEVDTLKLLLEMHETEISAITFQSHSKRDTIVKRMKIIKKQILKVYNDLVRLTEDHYQEMENILKRNQKPILQSVIKMKENTK